MFGFIDSASDHAAALSHFHSYVCFFLVLVIVFVVWLLKMILKFVVQERDLRVFNRATASIFGIEIPHLNYFFWIFSTLMPRGGLRQLIADFYYVILVTTNVKKIFYSYGVNKTLYPDQGSKINVFSSLPQLTPVSKSYVSPYSAGHYLSVYTISRSNSDLAVVGVFRRALHDVAFLFPYERVEIKSYGPYASVEQHITLHLFITSYILKLKDFSKNRLISGSSAWVYTSLDVKSLFGYTNDNTGGIFYKTYSSFVVPFFTFVNFYGSESRMFFYLFFQHVRHRKVLEWVWTCIPALILLLLLYPSLILLYCYDRPYITKPYLTFKAIGHQWYWSYEYSDFVTSSEEMKEHVKFDSYMIHQDDLELGRFRLLEVDRRIVLPLGICMRLITTSSDVLHSWAVPALGVKIDAVPGRLNQFWIVADRPGTFYGQCSEICGVNHGFMPIVVETTTFLSFFKALNAIMAQE